MGQRLTRLQDAGRRRRLRTAPTRAAGRLAAGARDVRPTARRIEGWSSRRSGRASSSSKCTGRAASRCSWSCGRSIARRSQLERLTARASRKSPRPAGKVQAAGPDRRPPHGRPGALGDPRTTASWCWDYQGTWFALESTADEAMTRRVDRAAGTDLHRLPSTAAAALGGAGQRAHPTVRRQRPVSSGPAASWAWRSRIRPFTWPTKPDPGRQRHEPFRRRAGPGQSAASPDQATVRRADGRNAGAA